MLIVDNKELLRSGDAYDYTKRASASEQERADEVFYAVVKTHKRRSNKNYNSKLTITKI